MKTRSDDPARPPSASPTDLVVKLATAAKEPASLDDSARVRLLEEAASTIRDLREQTACCDLPALEHPGDIVHDMRRMAKALHDFDNREVEEKLIEASAVIKLCQQLRDAGED